ncbi:hypothetical protein NSIN_30133 [Nitrosotalea sinensis]|uniref:HNH nuclease domain-containing protein n=1 Tax=Nitrosotalea sinensis TaxID=1499975 RepID=A0A2H1EIR2_9ARCH|nr:HNH endonuclease signature motif containing protein [Candidatus Nitrosotalea sinensis]SHO46495.1 hypothetical protein NSIN_30133 [Candidatus Nitrosotalea sinensis]
MTGLFTSKEEKQARKELENKVKILLKKYELDDMQKLCQNVIGKEPKPWRKYGEEYPVKGGTIQNYYPPDRGDFEDFIWDHMKKKEITYEQIQDYAIRHNLVPRNYFSDRPNLGSSNNIRRGFSQLIKDEVLEKQKGKCANCEKHSASFQFDHIDGNRNNNSSDNCQALCPNCHDVKSRNLD